MKTHLIASLATMLVLAFILPTASPAETVSTLTNMITVDTREGTKVLGRIVDGTPSVGPYGPLSGVAVSIGAQTLITGSNGAFELLVDLTAPLQITAEKVDFLTYTVDVAEPPGHGVVDLGLIPLRPNADAPVVEWLVQEPAGLFIQGWDVKFTGKARVNWNGFTPDSVEFFANGASVGTVFGPGPEYEIEFSVDNDFSPSLQLGGNEISVIATGIPTVPPLDPKSSEPVLDRCVVLPVPGSLQPYLSQAGKSSDKAKLGLSFEFPSTKPFGTFGIPVIGTVGGELSGFGNFSYDYLSGEWTFDAGGRFKGESTKYSKFKLRLGPLNQIDAKIEGKSKGAATFSNGIGIDLSKIDLVSSLSVGGNFPMGSYSPFGLLPPAATAEVLAIPVLSDVFKASSLILWVRPSLTGSGGIQGYPNFDWKDFELLGSSPIEAAYEPVLPKGYGCKLYFGGSPSLRFAYPGDLFREANFKLYFGLEAKLRALKFERNFVVVDESYPSAARRVPLDIGGAGEFLPDASNSAGWQAMDRPWRELGGEVFLPADSARKADRRFEFEPGTSELDTFLRMGLSPAPGASYSPATGPGRRIISDPDIPVQADLPLLANIFPDSDPALAGQGANLMLLYVRDTGASNPVQFTEVAYTHFDGTSWSVPAGLGGAPSTALGEGFNAATVPAGWAVDKPGFLDVMFVSASSQPSGFTPTEGSHMVRVNSYDVSSGTVRLRKTAPLSTIGLTGAKVSFDWTVDSGYSSSNDRVNVQWSADGVTWTSVGGVSRYAPTGSAWTEQSFNLPPAALGLPQVFVSFLFTTAYGNDCHLDNVRIQQFVVDGRGQFSPQVAFDGNGDAITVFERIRNPTFTGTDPASFVAEMEVVWSRWNRPARTWSEPVALTDNVFLDISPKLEGPMANGDLLLTWSQNEANQITGTGLAGAATNTRVMTQRWDHAAGTWSTPSILVNNLSSELSDDLAAAGDKAVFLWSVDLDGDLDDSGDSELFYRTYDATSDTWSATIRYTNDAIPDRDAKVAISASGDVYVIWNRDGTLVMDVNFSGNPSVVREESTSIGLANFALSIGPGGNLALIWQEMSEHGSDAHYRIYDPASGTWGLDARLSKDSDLERSFSPVWDAMGNLTLAYNNVTVTKETVSVELEGGTVVDVEGVPQPGQVDLLVAKRALVKDLEIPVGGLSASGLNYLPGDAVTLVAKVRNPGNLAIEDVAVSFYNGDPNDEGTLIDTVTLPGWLKAADEADASVLWTMPEPAIARTVFARVDVAGLVTEADEENNSQSLPLNGVDLQLDYLSGSVLADGSVRVLARVLTLSPPVSPVTMLRLQSEDGLTQLAEISVSQLPPGGAVEIPIDLPAGTQPEGNRSYRIIVDEEEISGDVDPSNNEVLFSLNLWIDGDGDGIPKAWEEANGMSDSNAADADLDVDGDGFTAKQEYLAGTDPRDASSVLKIGNVAQQPSPDGLSTLVSWSSVAGRRYQVERSFDLSSWTILEGEVEATPPLNTVLDTGVPPNGKAFYRLSVK